MEIRDMQTKAKSFSINALMRNKKISQALTDAWEAPLGSTKRDAARSLLKSVEGAKRNSMYDGAGGWFGDLWSNITGYLGGSGSSSTPSSTQPSGSSPLTYSGQQTGTGTQSPSSNVNVIGAQPTMSGSGVQFLGGSFNLPTLNKDGTMSQATQPQMDFGLKFDSSGNPIKPAAGNTNQSLLYNGQPGGTANVLGGMAPNTMSSPLDLKPTYALNQPSGAPSVYNGISIPYSWSPVSTDSNDFMGNMFLYERKPDGSVTKVGRYATIKNPNTGGTQSIDLTKATPYQKALYLGEEYVKNSLSPEQKALAETNKWSLAGRQTEKNGYLYIPSTSEIAQAASLKMKFVYDPASGWKTESVTAPSIEQKATDNKTKEDVKAEVKNMIDASQMSTFGNEGLDAWWKNIEKGMAEGETKDALRELYEWKMANPGASAEQVEALADRIMNDRTLFSYVTGIPKGSVPVGITLAGQQQQAYDMAMKEMGMYDKLNELFRQQQSGIGYANQMQSYVRDKDQYLEQVDRMKDEAYQKMKMLDMSNPYVANRMEKYTSFLDVARGKANLRYSNFLQTAVNERNNEITQAQTAISQAMPFFEQTLTNLTNAGTEAYTRLRNSAKDLAASLSGANASWQQAKTFEKQMLVADATAIKAAAGTTADKLSTTSNEALIKSVTESKAYDLDTISKLLGSNLGMTSQQMLTGLSAGADSLIKTGATTGNYGADIDGLITGLKTMTEKEQIDALKSNELLESYKQSLTSGIKSYVSSSEDVIKDLRNLINDLTDYNTYQSIANASTIDELKKDYSGVPGRVVEDTALTFANYLKQVKKKPDYSEDNETFASELASDIAAMYGPGKLYQ